MAHVDNSELESINWTIAIILLQVTESNNACRDCWRKHATTDGTRLSTNVREHSSEEHGQDPTNLELQEENHF